MRTREYIEKGEAEGKTFLDAMRHGITEGMPYFDGAIEKPDSDRRRRVRGGSLLRDQPGNLRLEMADFLDERAAGTRSDGSSGSTEIEMER